MDSVFEEIGHCHVKSFTPSSEGGEESMRMRSSEQDINRDKLQFGARHDVLGKIRVAP